MSQRFAVGMVLLVPLASAAADLARQRAQNLREFVHQDCGACHGMRLTGGLGPALTASALEGRSPQTLAAIIREGRSGTPMPPWKDLLSEAEIQWIVDYLTGAER